MARLLPLALLLLTGCAHNLANCDNARAAAQLATLAMARICPIAEAGWTSGGDTHIVRPLPRSLP